MNGTGRSWGAITIVNALFTGVGSAAAISLPVEAEAVLLPAAGSKARLLTTPKDEGPLLRAVVRESLRRYASPGRWDVQVTVRSSIPAGRGLKSSSAVSCAVVSAIASAANRPVGALEVARLSAAVARGIGQSATGAFDDALAGTAGGLVVARNGPDSLLRTDALDPSWRVVVRIPSTRHLPSPNWLPAFRALREEGAAAARLACSRSYPEAMAQNTDLVERVIGSDHRSLRAGLSRLGAVAIGVSGMGPTLAVVAPAKLCPAIVQALSKGPDEIRTLDFVGPSWGGPAGVRG